MAEANRGATCSRSRERNEREKLNGRGERGGGLAGFGGGADGT
jgi:hypothetical protein